MLSRAARVVYGPGASSVWRQVGNGSRGSTGVQVGSTRVGPSCMAAVTWWRSARGATGDAAASAGFLAQEEVQERVLMVVRNFEKVAPDQVTADSHFTNDLGLDSLDTVELVMAMEEEFAIEIPDADADKILTCKDAVGYISNNPNAK
eukprot:CAMPEP_0184680954 /NCGR_PEP_ID=MMETSP0312-20130426/3879_1 /TAXON_ID=31354 /ORGANISM="Compsopogon coeruleus, Strain SAG 36.94" /LENGTH=147 /DNA_ID=CAMNT_0027131431 /DNA_START=52 /DNA_END=495 /DNA_ORIENTATION=-